MRLKYVVTLSTLLALLVWTDVGAQRRGGTVVISTRGSRGMRGTPAPPPREDIGDVSKVALYSIKLAKPQDESVKSLNKSFGAQEKELIRLANMASGRSGGGGGGGGGRRGGGSGRSAVAPQLDDALFELHAKFITSVREVLTEEQRPVLDANLEAHERKIQEALDKAALSPRRGRGT